MTVRNGGVSCSLCILHSSFCTRFQREIERCALVEFALRPGAPAVPGDDAADVGQADAGAFKLLDRVQALEHAEKFVAILRVEPDAIVAHEKCRMRNAECRIGPRNRFFIHHAAFCRVLSATVRGGIFPWRSVKGSSVALKMRNLQTAGGPAAVA